MSLFLDSNTLIYLIEGSAGVSDYVRDKLTSYPTSARWIVSALSRLECRSKPLAEGRTALLSHYDAFFASNRVLIVGIDNPVIDKATDIRGRYGLKTPDAILAASAIVAGASAFVTADKMLQRCIELKVDLLEFI